VETAIKVEKLVKKYAQVIALKGISLEVQEGTIYGLLGPNGAGKTTTINILATLLKPSAGTAYIHGFNVVTQPKKARRLIDIVPQRLCLDLRLTGYKNIYFHGRLKGVPSSILRKRIDELAEALDMKRHLKRRVREYSGGMIRKIQIMQALVTRPKVLLLDEPTLTLDPVSRRIVWDLFRRLVLEEKTTIFMATHNTMEAEILCDKVGLLNCGLLVKEGAPNILKEQVGVGVLEIRVKEEYLNRVVSAISEYLGEKIARIRSTLYVFLDKEEYFEPLTAKIRDYCLEVIYRKVTLEDVFIKEVGRKIVG